MAGHGSGREEEGVIMRVISNWKWALMKRIVIAHMKVASKYSFKTGTAWHLKLFWLVGGCPMAYVQLLCVYKSRLAVEC